MREDNSRLTGDSFTYLQLAKHNQAIKRPKGFNHILKSIQQVVRPLEGQTPWHPPLAPTFSCHVASSHKFPASDEVILHHVSRREGTNAIRKLQHFGASAGQDLATWQNRDGASAWLGCFQRIFSSDSVHSLCPSYSLKLINPTWSHIHPSSCLSDNGNS